MQTVDAYDKALGLNRFELPIDGGWFYWAGNNTLSVLQQAFIMNKHGAKIELWDNVAGMFGKKDGGKK